MPIRAATVAVTAWRRPSSSTKYCFQKRMAPMGMRAKPMKRISLVREAIISDWPAFTSFLASSVSRAA